MAEMTTPDLIDRIKAALGLRGGKSITNAQNSLFPTFVANPPSRPVPVRESFSERTIIRVTGVSTSVPSTTWTTLRSYVVPAGKIFYVTDAVAYQDGGQAGAHASVITTNAAGTILTAESVLIDQNSNGSGSDYGKDSAHLRTPFVAVSGETVYVRMVQNGVLARNCNAMLLGWIEDA